MVGDRDFVQIKIQERIKAVQDLTLQLPNLQDAHAEFVLLRSCFSLPKVMYMLRTTDPTQNLELWANFDSIIRDTLSNIL